MCHSFSDNTPPTISGPTVVYVTRGKIFEETFTVYDADGHNITAFELVQVIQPLNPKGCSV